MMKVFSIKDKKNSVLVTTFHINVMINILVKQPYIYLHNKVDKAIKDCSGRRLLKCHNSTFEI